LYPPAIVTRMDGGGGSILLELLPWAVDAGLQRVRGQAGIATPDLPQKHLPKNGRGGGKRGVALLLSGT
jgi:hypothetical protein